MLPTHFLRKSIVVVFFLGGMFCHPQASYNPDMAMRTLIRKAAWKELKLKTPQKQHFMTGLLFNSNQCFNLYGKAAKKYGWKPYELHTIAAFHRIVLEEIVSGRTFTESEVENIYNEVKSDYLRRDIDGSLNNVLKQRKYDGLIVEGMWFGYVFELSKKNNPEIVVLAKQTLRAKKENLKEHTSDEDTVSEIETKENQQAQKPPQINDNTTSKIDDIILRTVTSYGLDGVYITNDVSVLYVNGDVFTNPSKPLESLNIAASKRTKPKKWRTWKKKGGILYVTDPRKRKTYDWKKWFKVRAGSKGFKLSGKFNTLDAFGGAAVINASTVFFDKQGRFAWKTIKGGNTSWKPIFSKSSSAGTYIIEDYTITLKYNNGVEEAFFFGLYPKDNLHFIIGSSHFVPVKE